MHHSTPKRRHLRRATFALLAGTGLLAVGACTTVVRPTVVAPAPRAVIEMPAPPREVPPAPPQPGWHWIPGHYTWHGDGWHWIPGRYVAQAVAPMPPPQQEVIVVAPSPAHVWVRGHWAWQGGWVWMPGRWVVRG